jgi:hypothetical protein
MQATKTVPQTSSEVQLLLALEYDQVPAVAKTRCNQCNGTGTVWVKRDGRNVETSCKRCGGEGEL